jgi:hypothetical protein
MVFFMIYRNYGRDLRLLLCRSRSNVPRPNSIALSPPSLEYYKEVDMVFLVTSLLTIVADAPSETSIHMPLARRHSTWRRTLQL